MTLTGQQFIGYGT